MQKRIMATGIALLCLLGMIGSVTQAQNRPALQKNSVLQGSDRNQHLQKLLAGAVRHELLTLPYYDVFDWLEAEVGSDGRVILLGEVVRPTTSDDEKRMQSIEGVSSVLNQIRVLPLSSSDNDLRIALYRAIYDWNSPLFRYAMRAMPPIHIVVENGRVTLKGVVATQSESQLAYNAANRVAGIFEVRNELQIG